MLDIYCWYILKLMSEPDIAKLFRNGRSQAVRLPRDYRFEGDRVRVRRVPEGVLLEPMISDVGQWFTELDRLKTTGYMNDGRKQPVTPKREIFK